MLAAVLIAATIANGQIADNIATASDPEMTYAVYLPAAYTAERKWPVVFVLDPRRRGAFAADLFRDAAEQYGWIVISSNNTESDSANAPNIRALQAMFADVPARFSIDDRRIYLAGFSGTANLAFSVAERTGAIAGVIGCSGWLPADWKVHDPGFAWFGTAGTLDFNYVPSREIDDRLGRAKARHRLEFFPSTHRWAPKPLLAEAIAWMELQAMRDGTRSKDAALIATLYDRDLAAANAESDPLTAMRRFEAIARSFDGLTDAGAAQSRAAELRKSPDVARAEGEEKKATEFEKRQLDHVAPVYESFLAADTPPPAGQLAQQLGIAQLTKVSKEPSRMGLAAQRVLASIYGQVHFYLPQQVQGSKLLVLQAVSKMMDQAK